MRKHRIAGPLFAALLAAAAGTVQAQSAWKPDRNVELLIASTAGTGPDRVARIIQRLWREQKMVDATTTVVTKPGGGGAVLWAYMAQRPGDAHYLMITSYNIVVNHILGKSTQTHTDFTPISLLISEYIGYSVRADSPFRTLADLVNGFRENPEAYPIAVSSNTGGANHIAIALLLKAAGVDLKRLKVVVFSGYNQAMTAVLGGHAAVVSGSAGAIAPFQANAQARTLAFASPQRLGGIYAGVPTTGEAGYRFTANNWRLVMAPKGLDAAEIAYWDDVFRKLATSSEWKQELETNYLSNDYLDSETTRKYLAEQYGEVKQILTDLGLVKPAK